MSVAAGAEGARSHGHADLAAYIYGFNSTAQLFKLYNAAREYLHEANFVKALCTPS